MGFTPFGAGKALLVANNLSDVASPAAALGNIGGQGMQATTGVAGFALQNGTPTIISWTAPNDGQMHRFQVFSMLHVTVLEVGGQVNVLFTGPFAGAVQHSSQLFAGALGTDTSGQPSSLSDIIGPGTTVSITQTALTSGAAVLFAEIWGS